jgi:vacuolar-type H+-ATPase subunit I/STV1
MKKQRLKAVALSTVLSASALMGSVAMADQTLNAVLKVGQAKTTLAQDSQKRIDRLAQETDDLLQNFKAQNKLIEDLRVFNAQMEKQVAKQLEVVSDLEQSIEKVTVIERQIQPLIFRMLDGLAQFVTLDKPFQLEERQARIEMLRANQDRADISVSEKFRQVLEAYKIESAYGGTLDAYKTTLSIDGVDREVSILRVGRISMMYQTSDAQSSGYWDAAQSQWVGLDSSYNARIMKGLKIARDQATKDILVLNIQAPEVVAQ